MSEQPFEFNQLLRELKRIQKTRREVDAREREILVRLEAIGVPKPAEPAELFRVGDEVFITNKIGHGPKDRATSILDRAARVIRVHNGKVYLETFSGYSTWRIEKNLRFLSSQDRVIIAKA